MCLNFRSYFYCLADDDLFYKNNADPAYAIVPINAQFSAGSQIRETAAAFALAVF